MSLTRNLIENLTKDLAEDLIPTPFSGPAFTSTWQTDAPFTTSDDDQVLLPLLSTGTYNFEVRWGDGTSDIITSWDQADILHTYPSIGTYTIRIRGTIDGFNFNEQTSGGDDNKFIGVSNWGPLRVGNDGGYFQNCGNLTSITATDALDTSGMTNFFGFFLATSITEVPSIALWDWSTVTDVTAMFLFCPNYNQDLNDLDVSNVEIFIGMFQFATLFNGTVSNWDMSSATNIAGIFSDTAFNQDVSGWNVSNITDAGTFTSNSSFSIENYNKLLNSWSQQSLQSGVALGTSAQYSIGLPTLSKDTLIDDFSWVITDGGQEVDTDFISTWLTTNAGTSNSDQISLPLESDGTYNFDVDWGDGNMDTITVWDQAETTHTYTTAGTYTIRIDGTIQGWRFNNGGDKDKITFIHNWGQLIIGNNNGYFQSCTNLVIYATNTLDISGTTNLNDAFRDCDSTPDIPYINTWNFSNVTTLDQAFRGCNALNNINFDNIDVSGVTNMSQTFRDCTSLVNASFLNWDVSNVLNFERFLSVTSFVGDSTMDAWVTSSATNFTNMFRSSDFDGDLSAWNVSSGTDFDNMLRNTPFSAIGGINSWNMANAQNLSRMFQDSLFNSPVSNWVVSSVVDFDRMFQDTPFDQDVSLWNVSSGEDFGHMFRDTPFSAINGINSWVMTNATGINNMFRDCLSFDSDISGWNVINVTNTSNIMMNSGFTQTNYDLLLIAWDLLALQSGNTFDAGTAQYDSGAAATARADIIATFSWSFQDGGQAP